jgi:hypothetical protein
VLQLFRDHLLEFIVWGPFAVLTLVLFLIRSVRGPSLRVWFLDHAKPLLVVSTCFAVAVLAEVVSDRANLAAILPQQHGSGAVAGPDLIVNLLTISALTISSGFAYLCLPSDRAEMRLAATTKDSLLSSGIEAESYIAWYETLEPSDQTPSSKLLFGLLSPRDAMGGWYLLKVEDFRDALGADAWNRFARYVDQHVDDSWIRLCLYAVAGGMSMGMLCLFSRYFGLTHTFFNPVEFGVIVLLVCLNVSVAYFIVSLAFDVHIVEAKVTAGIRRAVNDQKPAVARWLKQRSQALADEMKSRAETRIPDPDQNTLKLDPPPLLPPPPPGRKRRNS